MQSNDLMAQEVKNESLRKSALTQMNAGRFGEAIDLLNKFISANPQYAEGYNLRGICHRARNQFQNAVLDFRRAVKLKPDYRDAARNLAEAQAIWYAELEKKILGHKREIAINPDTPYNYLEIGKSYRWMEEWALAEEWYDQYLARDDDASPDEIIRYSEILAKTKHIRKGEKILKIYVERYPDDWRLWSKYGYFTMWMGRYKNAAKAFRTALQFKPYFKEAQDGLDMATKQAYVTQQDPRAFEKEFPIDRYYRILRKNPDDLDTKFLLVDELIKAERIEEAYTQMLEIRVDYSDDERFQERFDYVVDFRERVYRQRIADYTARVEANPTDKIAVQRLADYYQFLEEYESALAVLENYFIVVPDESDQQMRFQYAKIAAWDREFFLAIDVVDQLLIESPDNLEYQLFRAQLSIWNDVDIELIEPYLENVLSSQPRNIDALIAMGSYKLMEKDYDAAQMYADSAQSVDQYNTDLVTLQTNIDFQKLRAEEEARYEILEEGRQLVVDGECESALRYYERYLEQSEPNYLIMKEYADVLYCAERYEEALDIYNNVLSGGYFFEASLQRAKLLYTIKDTTDALDAFRKLASEEPGEFEPYLYLGDAFALAEEYDSAHAVYDSLMTWNLDSSQVAMIEIRRGWIPVTGLRGIITSFPASMGLAPSLSYYSDNTSFSFTKAGARLDLGVTEFFSLGVSFYKTFFNAQREKLDSNIISSLEQQGYPFAGSRTYTALKGHIFFNFSRELTAGFAYGSLNSEGETKEPETEMYLRYDDQTEDFWLLGSYYNSDATHILYSPYLIDYKLRATLTKFAGLYVHPASKFLARGYFQYVRVSDGNEGNDFLIRLGKYFNQDLAAGYEFWYSNFKYAGDDSPLYYSPENFNSHSLWFDYDLEKDAVAKLIIGGKVGYVPQDDFVSMEGHIDIFYRFSPQLSLNGNLSLGNNSREGSDYSFFSGSVSLYWGF
jgi:Flp pilus assembly protein TadD